MGYNIYIIKKKSESQESWKGGKKNQKESLLCWKNRKIQKNTDGQTKSWEKSCYFDDDA